MSGDNHPLLENFPHARVAWKALLSYFAILGAGSILKDWVKLVEQLRLWMFDNLISLAAGFLGIYAIVLALECIIRTQREQIEAKRSSPMLPRRARQKAARKQRLRNQQRAR